MDIENSQLILGKPSKLLSPFEGPLQHKYERSSRLIIRRRSALNSPAIRLCTRNEYVPYKAFTSSRRSSHQNSPKSRLHEYLRTKSDVNVKIRMPEYFKKEESKSTIRQRDIILKRCIKSESTSKLRTPDLCKSVRIKRKNTTSENSVSGEISCRKDKSHCYVNYKKQLGRNNVKEKYNDEEYEAGFSWRRLNLKKYPPILPMNREAFDHYRRILRSSVKRVEKCLDYTTSKTRRNKLNFAIKYAN